MSRSNHRRAKPAGSAGRRAKPTGRPAQDATDADIATSDQEPDEDNRRFRPKTVLKYLSAAGALGFLGVLVMCGVAYAMTEVPPVKELAQAQATVIEWRDGSEMAKIGKQNRLAVSLKEVPDHLEHAVMAAENGAFYDQPLGISPKGIARAAWTTLTTDQLAGGSTITQQYAQKAYLAEGRTLTTKFKEFFLTLKLEQRLSKDQILENYLNTIYFGRSSYGVEAASQAYFHKHVRDLTVAESAFIATVLNSPGSFDPANGPEAKEAAKGRWQYVTGRMVEEGWLSPAKAQRLKFPRVAAPAQDGDTYGGPQGYVLKRVEHILTKELGFTEREIATRGLHIRTTLDKRMQRQAVRSVKQTLPKKWPYQRANAGLVSVEPGTGKILAMFGGRDYLKDNYGNVFRARPQMGSSFKPYVLAAALQEGIGLRSRFNGDSPRTFANGYEVGNSHDVSYGMIDLPTATKYSVNTVYVDLALETGIPNVIDAAADAGLPKKQLQNNVDASIALGTVSVHPIEQAAGMATFASGGIYAEPHLVLEVRNAQGAVLQKVEPETHRAFSKDVAADVAYAMQQVVKAGGTGANARLEGRPVAGKTGTTQRNRAVWFVGYTPQVATAVTIFHPDFKPMRDVPVYGTVSSGVPADIWHAYMAVAMKGKPVKQFREPAWVGDVMNSAPPSTPTPSGPSPSASASETEREPRPTVTISTPEPSTSPPGPPPDTDTPDPEPSTPPPDDGGDDDDCGLFGCPGGADSPQGQGQRPPEGE